MYFFCAIRNNNNNIRRYFSGIYTFPLKKAKPAGKQTFFFGVITNNNNILYICVIYYFNICQLLLLVYINIIIIYCKTIKRTRYRFCKTVLSLKQR